MKQNNFRIVVPVYNSEQWITQCINSISFQKYDNWTSIILDDSSTDNTLEKIKAALKDNPKKEHFSVFHRTKNVGALENTIFGSNKLCTDDEDIIVVVDGDDWLTDSNVFSFLNEVYQDDNVWLTYGSFVHLSTGHNGINKHLNDTRNYRRSLDYCTSHLRTYKFKIWKKIRDEDFRDAAGNYYKITGDLAVMFPLIEMAGYKRIKFIEKPLYVYNDTNPIGDSKIKMQLQISTNLEIRRNHLYMELP